MTLAPDQTTPPDPNKAAHKRRRIILTVGILLGLFFLGKDVISAFVSVREKRDAQLAAFKRETEAVKQVVKSPDDLTDPEKFKKVKEASDRMADAAGAVDPRMKPVTKAVIDEFTAIGLEVAGISKQTGDAGGIDAATMPTREAADQRVTLLKSCRDRAAAVVTRIEALPQTVKSLAITNGLNEREAEAYVTSINKSDRLKYQKNIRSLDVQVLESMVEIATLLRDTHGQWTITAQGLAFNDAPLGTSAKYTQLLEKISVLSKQQEEMMAKLQPAP